MARVATGVKHKIGSYWEAARDGTPDIGVLLLISAGLEHEDGLADRDTVADILAATNDEATFTNYTRKIVTPAIVRDDAADTMTITLAGEPPLIIDWAAAGGAGGLGTNNVLGRVVYYYDPAPGSSTDAQKLHLASAPITSTTDGSTLRVTIPQTGIATYRDGVAAPASAGPATVIPTDGSVTDAKVAAGAAISLDKTADSGTRLAMSAAERTKLGGVATGATARPAPDVQVFTANGTWTKPVGVTVVRVETIAGGMGGCSGARRASGTASSGGAGGGSGGYSDLMIPADLVGATEAVTVGAGGAGGAAVTTNDTDGASGALGGISRFGPTGATTGLVQANPGFTAGQGGRAAAAATGGSAGTGLQNGQAGAAGNNGATGSQGARGGKAGGGGSSGGGISTTPAAFSGGAGGLSLYRSDQGSAAGAINGNGNTGTSVIPDVVAGGGGGSGGGSSITGAGGNGGAGGIYGAGGGGGGSSLNGFNSGAGGNGAPGVVVVTSW